MYAWCVLMSESYGNLGLIVCEWGKSCGLSVWDNNWMIYIFLCSVFSTPARAKTAVEGMELLTSKQCICYNK